MPDRHAATALKCGGRASLPRQVIGGNVDVRSFPKKTFPNVARARVAPQYRSWKLTVRGSRITDWKITPGAPRSLSESYHAYRVRVAVSMTQTGS